LILADTSIWIDHFRSGNKEMRKHLNEGQIVIHPSIIAELALGSLQERSKTLALLDLLPQVRVAQLSEVRRMIEARRLYSLGIGLIDAHLIALSLHQSVHASVDKRQATPQGRRSSRYSRQSALENLKKQSVSQVCLAACRVC
jgi:predicted nucleic acid-binding protein